jgi:catechol 2,3-dioxygenase-like lactoylglutathione lyase family enzyme
MAELLQVTPFVPCRDLQKQITFYCEVLGFTCSFQADNYAYLKQGRVALRLLECPARSDGLPLGGDLSFYIDTDDVDQLYQALMPGLSQLPPERLRAPFDQPYGQREFHVKDEDGALVFFGMPLQSSG